MSIHIRRRTFTAVALAVALGAMRVRAQPRPEKPRITIAVGGKAEFYYLPLTITEQLGYFKDEGLDVEIADFADDSRALQAVVSGAADVCCGAFEETISLQAKNQLFRAFVMEGRAPEIAVGVSRKNMPAYGGIDDLKGKKIGVSALGSSAHMVASLLLAHAGLKASEVRWVEVGASAGALTALRSGQIDAISDIDPVMTMLEQKGDVKIISDTRTLKDTQDVFGGPMPAACLHAPAEFIQRYPATCQALADAIVHGLKWLQTAGPGDIIKTVPQAYLLGDRALYLASFDRLRESIATDGMIPADGPATALRAVASFDPMVKADRIDLSKLYTNEFALRAKYRFKA